MQLLTDFGRKHRALTAQTATKPFDTRLCDLNLQFVASNNETFLLLRMFPPMETHLKVHHHDRKVAFFPPLVKSTHQAIEFCYFLRTSSHRKVCVIINLFMLRATFVSRFPGKAAVFPSQERGINTTLNTLEKKNPRRQRKNLQTSHRKGRNQSSNVLIPASLVLKQA